MSDDVFAFGGKFNAIFDIAKKLILITLKRAYQEILNREEGTAFSLPRDAKVWERIKRNFDDNLSLVQQIR